jgi:predicted transcriptional regulator of viral defense system
MQKTPSPPTITDRARLLRLFEERGGYLTSGEISQINLPGIVLTRSIEHGLIERVQRGVYRLSDTNHLPAVDAEAEELLELQLRFPAARPCLVSALHLHGLTTTRPVALQLAIPANQRGLKVDTPALEVFFFAPKYYDEGIVTLELRQRKLLVYSPEKTLCDLLRYAPKFGRELYLEGLKKYLHQHQSHDLIAMAKRLDIWSELGRDLEVLAHDQDR